MISVRPITNPLEWQERTSLQRGSTPLSSSSQRIALLALALAFGFIVWTLGDIRGPTRELGMLLVWLFHGLAAARAIAAATNAISREHINHTWTPLILTGVSARRILLGKWLAVMHHVAPVMLALGAVRLLMLPIFMLAFVNRFAWRTLYRGGYGGYYDGSTAIEWVAWASLLAVVMTVGLTLLEMMCCTALGLAASAVLRRRGLAMVAALVIRFAPVILFAAITRYEVDDGPFWRVLRFTPLALADGGSAPLYQLILPRTTWTMSAHQAALPGILLAAGLLVGLLVVALVVAQAAIQRAGALPHEVEERPVRRLYWLRSPVRLANPQEGFPSTPG
ncbi:MAG: ABC transporter permease subunit [Chloroflexi bacterium]|nr:ABC transporter permease subunit [Chloroflexota bacterium]